MDNKVTLSSTFNMSLGFIPVIISMILCQFISGDLAIYIGAITGLFLSLIWYLDSRCKAVNFVLSVATVILVVYSLLFITRLVDSNVKWIPFSLEVSMLIFLGVFYLFRKRLSAFFERRNSKGGNAFMHGVESTIVAIQVLFIIVIIHFAVIIIAGLVTLSPVGNNTKFFLYNLLPPFVLISCILFNQYGLYYFNKLMSHTKYISVVNNQGKVIGRASKLDAVDYKNKFTNPVIRIIPIYENMIFLCQRSMESIFDKGKIDTPMETFLNYNEKIESAVKRLLNDSFPGVKDLETTFTIKYHLKTEETSRLIYLFTLFVNNSDVLRNEACKNCKLWTLPLIEQNLNINYFSTSMEHEYEFLKDIIYTREKYRAI